MPNPFSNLVKGKHLQIGRASKPKHIRENHAMHVIIKPPKAKYKFSKATRNHSTVGH